MVEYKVNSEVKYSRSINMENFIELIKAEIKNIEENMSGL